MCQDCVRSLVSVKCLLFIPNDDTSNDALEGGDESDECDLADGSVPTPKRRKLAREDGLKKTLFRALSTILGRSRSF